ncbi:hypothetical protein [Polaribacter sp. IC073]|uniref:hypothetical protein n=1 Tax=Polaribacter sp. IC073 TaxID=2508540 RepID=UPI0011BEA38E|nr:hypothetical protein [Polaribacter sp. IC073]TXD49419.1 hypothetical protein ES045_04970 [Polaribacter sp. IC073]
MDILDSFGDFIQFAITLIVTIVGIKIASSSINGNNSNSLPILIGIPIVTVWIFFDYDIYLGLILGSIVSLIITSKSSENEHKIEENIMAIVILVLTIGKFFYFGFIK